WYRRVVRGERTKRRQPKRSSCDAAARRIGSIRRQAAGDARGQDARCKIDERLREHDGFPARPRQKINRREKRRIAGDARIRGKKLPVGVEAVNTVVQPVAGQLFVVGRIARIEREAPDEKEAQRKSSEE